MVGRWKSVSNPEILKIHIAHPVNIMKSRVLLLIFPPYSTTQHWALILNRTTTSITHTPDSICLQTNPIAPSPRIPGKLPLDLISIPSMSIITSSVLVFLMVRKVCVYVYYRLTLLTRRTVTTKEAKTNTTTIERGLAFSKS